MDTFILIVGLISIQAFLAAGLMILNDIRKMLRENDDGQDVLREENQQERRYDELLQAVESAKEDCPPWSVCIEYNVRIKEN